MNNKRVNFFFIIFSLIFVPVSSLAQGAKDWTGHISYTADITELVQSGDIIYAVTDGKLFIYNSTDESLEEYIKYEGGNTDITHISYNQKHKCLFITRADANIELLYDDKSYSNISDLKNYTGQNIDKTINSVFMEDDYAYLSTNFGFSIIDLDEKVIKESGIFNIPFYSICSYANKLYATSKDGVLSADKDSNVQDIVNWKNFSVSNFYNGTDYQFQDNEITKIVLFKEKLHFLVPNRAAYIMEDPTSVKRVLVSNTLNQMLKADNDHLIITSTSTCWDYENLTQYISINTDWIKYIIPNKSKSGEYWLASGGNNLSLIRNTDSEVEFIKRWICPQGPASNLPFSQTYGNNQLILTGGGFYTNRYFTPASLSIYKDSKWRNIYTSSINQESGINAMDFTYAISDPQNPNHIFASSWGEGLYEFQDGKFVQRYDKTNSTIEEIVVKGGEGEEDFRTTRISGMVYDKNNNLYLLNSMVENIIKVYQKNGEWGQIYYGGIANANTNPKNIIIDRYSNKWITTVGQDDYILIFNDNGTISNTSDDKYKLVNTFTDQSGNSLFVIDIHGITEDNNGNMWLSTNIGPFMIYNSSDIFNKNIVLYRHKIEKEPGSNTQVNLLEDIVINAIAVDGANQKWIATQSAGVYLLSSDNSEILEHFTLDNSPLPSNNIISLSIDSKGNVFFGSDRGLMSYNTRITPGAENFSDVYVYPNPVRPDFSGLITVTGLRSDSRVKITDVRGNLIIEGKSLGGQFLWDGLNAKKRRVDTGVYLVFGSSEDGSEGVVTKIMIVNE